MERMDFRLSDKDNLYWRYVFDPSSTINPHNTPTFYNNLEGTDHLVVASETHIFSGTSINEFRFGFNRTYAAQISGAVNDIAKTSNPSTMLSTTQIATTTNWNEVMLLSRSAYLTGKTAELLRRTREALFPQR